MNPLSPETLGLITKAEEALGADPENELGNTFHLLFRNSLRRTFEGNFVEGILDSSFTRFERHYQSYHEQAPRKAAIALTLLHSYIPVYVDYIFGMNRAVAIDKLEKQLKGLAGEAQAIIFLRALRQDMDSFILEGLKDLGIAIPKTKNR